MSPLNTLNSRLLFMMWGYDELLWRLEDQCSTSCFKAASPQSQRVHTPFFSTFIISIARTASFATFRANVYCIVYHNTLFNFGYWKQCYKAHILPLWWSHALIQFSNMISSTIKFISQSISFKHGGNSSNISIQLL